MPSKEERDRRKKMVHHVQHNERAEAEGKMPIPKDVLKALFDWLDGKPADGCDHTLRFTKEFLEARRLPPEPIIRWLGQYSGYCDCEVLANVEEAWQ